MARGRHGTEQRQRQRLLAMRVNADEEKQIRRRAADAGLTVAGFLRQAVADTAEMHEWRCPSCHAVTRARMADHYPTG